MPCTVHTCRLYSASGIRRFDSHLGFDSLIDPQSQRDDTERTVSGS